MKNYADSESVICLSLQLQKYYTLLDLHNSLYHTQHHPIMVNVCLSYGGLQTTQDIIQVRNNSTGVGRQIYVTATGLLLMVFYCTMSGLAGISTGNSGNFGIKDLHLRTPLISRQLV